MDPKGLPIQSIREELALALSAGRRFVLEAPTGSGKSTQVPQMLADMPGCGVSGQIVVLQPRRVAARMLARRVAWERGVKLGAEVGYQVRFERVFGRDTRILFVTEGVLLRRMLDDPELKGVGAVLFDEFHERHIYGDVTLAQALILQRGRRPNLVLGAMSATLDGAPLREFLAPCAHLRCEGRMFPVDIRYAGSPAVSVRDEEPVWDRAAREAERVLREEPEGDMLIFMPGAFEIRRTIEALQGRSAAKGCDILPLHGELPPEAQDAAIDPSARRKIIVATNVAETSLTIDGVRVVIDGGLARIPAYDPQRGIDTILVKKISRASADQRAGRAGRTAPGVCVRLWSQRDHEQRAAREEAEIRRIDLSEVLLFLKTAGVDDLAAFPWFEPPEEKSMARALTLLSDLGALDHRGRITPVGRRMAAFPLHPRFARMLMEGERLGCLRTAALVAALSQDRSIVMPMDNGRERAAREDFLRGYVPDLDDSDFFMDIAAFAAAAEARFDMGFCRKWGIHATGARTAARLFEQLCGTARGAGLNPVDSAASGENIRRAILAGFSDQLALRTDRATLRCAVVHDRRGELRRETLVEAPLLVAAEIEERNVRGDVGVLLSRNTAVQESWLEEMFPEDFSRTREVVFDESQRRVSARARRMFRNLVLEDSQSGEPTPDEAAPLLAAEVLAGRLILKQWDAEVERWIARCNFVARHFPDYGIHAIGEAEKTLLIEQVCYGAIGYKDIKDRPVMPQLRDWLAAGQEPLLDKCAPERVELPRGIKARVRYEPDGRAFLAATVQQLYDAPGQILLGGRVPVVFEILAPNRRPVQITADLAAFWKGAYEDVKKQQKGRYPRHEWR
ncbi:MAG: ATP-dependent helicase C-terminal domain-containing protein [Opitutales bacterium]|jgi:ATP-dependent helicase HrpB